VSVLDMRFIDARPPTFVKVGGTLAWLLLAVVGPPVGFAIIALDEASAGRPALPVEALETGLFFGVGLAVGILISGPTLRWTLWGTPPRFIKCYTLGWTGTFLLVVFPMGFVLVMMALSHPPGLPLFIGGMMMMTVPVALPLSLFLGLGPGLVLLIASRRWSKPGGVQPSAG